MNLHAIAGPIIAAVNPMTAATVSVSTGSTVQPDGTVVPRYAQPPQNVSAQVQPMSTKDLRQVEGLNLQGNLVAIYLYGRVDGIVRSENKGGDKITIATGPSAGVYLTTIVLEQWNDWVKVAATLQNGS